MKRKIIVGFIGGIFALAILSFGWWLAGWNFNARGPEALVFYVMALMFIGGGSRLFIELFAPYRWDR